MLENHVCLFLIAPLFFFGLSGCVKVEDNEAPVNHEAVVAPENLTTQARAVSLVEPNSYQVEMPVPEGAAVLLKSGGETAEIQEIPLIANPSQYVDKKVVAGKTYRYQFGLYSSQLFQKISEENITVPLDLVVQGTLENSKGEKVDWSQYHRIFLRDGATVITYGANFVIKTDEIYSWRATFRSFPEKYDTQFGKNGRPGGDIEITTKKISGKVRFILDGENGGDGILGEAFVSPAPSGQDGKAMLRFLPNFEIERCMKMANPTNGQNGLPGRPGGNGGDGGNTGQVVLNYIEENNFQYSIEAKPGIGGKAGPGGSGQPGGHRGGWQGSACGESMLGELKVLDGISGPSGATGIAGQDGVKTRSCFYKNSQLINCN